MFCRDKRVFIISGSCHQYNFGRDKSLFCRDKSGDNPDWICLFRHYTSQHVTQHIFVVLSFVVTKVGATANDTKQFSQNSQFIVKQPLGFETDGSLENRNVTLNKPLRCKTFRGLQIFIKTICYNIDTILADKWIEFRHFVFVVPPPPPPLSLSLSLCCEVLDRN